MRKIDFMFTHLQAKFQESRAIVNKIILRFVRPNVSHENALTRLTFSLMDNASVGVIHWLAYLEIKKLTCQQSIMRGLPVECAYIVFDI